MNTLNNNLTIATRQSTKHISAIDLQGAILRISNIAPFTVYICDDLSYYPNGCTAELTHSKTGVFSLVSTKDNLKQNILKAATEIERTALLNALIEGGSDCSG